MITSSNVRLFSGCITRLGLFLAVSMGVTASAQTITVTTPMDVIDVPNNATIDDLPGPDGKLSMNEALLASDNTEGVQTIGFAIPESDWWLANIYPGQVLLQSSFGWSAQEPVIIDGTTQTAFTGDTFADGWEMTLDGLGLGLNGDDSELFGFHGCHVGLGGNNSVIHDNTGSMRISVGPFNSGNVIRDNEAWMIELTYSDNNVVVNNVTERVRITGLNSADRASSNRIGGLDPADRNFITGFGNYGEHGVPGGDCIELYYTDNTLIQNNYIGTTPDGMSISNPACTTGIRMMSVNDNLIVRNNLIAIQSFGIAQNSGVPFGQAMYVELYEGGTGIEVTGNTFGLNALGEPVLGSLNGIVVSRYVFEFGAEVRIGGPYLGEGNVIAGHLDAGVVMLNGTGVPVSGGIRLSGNSIYGNGDIGIDLMPNTWTFGHTENDNMDADVGANGLQNYPEILTATNNGLAIHSTGQLHSQPLKDYTLEFFASPECDPSGFGQGQIFLGSTSATTDAAGNAAFDVSLSAMVPTGWVITSTATLEPIGQTSEFSACLAIESETLTQVASDSYNVVRGFFVSGTLADTFASDDSYLKFNPGITLSPTEPPVWLEFVGTLPGDAPTSLAVTLEASANTIGLIQTMEMFNWNSGQYEAVDSRAASSNVDSVATVDLSASVADYVQSGTGTVKTRMGWRSTGPVLLYPWTVSIDQVSWSIQ